MLVKIDIAERFLPEALKAFKVYAELLKGYVGHSLFFEKWEILLCIELMVRSHRMDELVKIIIKKIE
ncbi:MAG: hypothetical protein AAFY76_19925 [Cyanobacteria bacterium J06649_11]